MSRQLPVKKLHVGRTFHEGASFMKAAGDSEHRPVSFKRFAAHLGTDVATLKMFFAQCARIGPPPPLPFARTEVEGALYRRDTLLAWWRATGRAAWAEYMARKKLRAS